MCQKPLYRLLPGRPCYLVCMNLFVVWRLVSGRLEKILIIGLAFNALYLFLVTVADLQGLSYYSDASICRRLRLDHLQLSSARQQLEKADLIAYRKPLYQVLSLLESSAASTSTALSGPRAAQTQSVGEILRRALTGGAP